MRIVAVEEHFTFPDLLCRIDLATLDRNGWPAPGTATRGSRENCTSKRRGTTAADASPITMPGWPERDARLTTDLRARAGVEYGGQAT
jgi:hypothetical protein